MDVKIFISVIMPALNEEGNVEAAVANTLKALDNFGIKGEVVVVNDGSVDNTGKLVNGLMEKDKRVRMFVHDTPKGIGASFWDGVDIAEGNIVVFFPADNKDDSCDIFRYHKLLENVDIVISFIANKEMRLPFRNALSYLYCFIINATFLVRFNYTNGTNLYRKSILKEMRYRNNSFFFQTDILVRAVKKGYLFAEVPCEFGVRNKGKSTALSLKSLWKIINGYLRLVAHYYLKPHKKMDSHFAEDSVTALRHKTSMDKNY
ncbi:MAG: glycosyltransferase family 2 protein [Candidatus Omnitrophica bacterium]|nr:glycosyltransferase family 2 protein [Candidatus Omnitrophota bacterium]